MARAFFRRVNSDTIGTIEGTKTDGWLEDPDTTITLCPLLSVGRMKVH